MKTILIIFSLALTFSSSNAQKIDCSADPQQYFFPDENPDDINPPSAEDNCDVAVRHATQCSQVLWTPFVQMAANSSFDHHEAFKNVIIETSGRTADFLANMAFVMDKTETQRIENIDRSLPGSMTRKMVAAKQLAKVNAHNFGAAIVATETLAASTFTSFGFFGSIGHFVGNVVHGIGNVVGGVARTVVGGFLGGGMGGGGSYYDPTPALNQISDRVRDLSGQMGGFNSRLQDIQAQIKQVEASAEQDKQELLNKLAQQKAEIENEIEKQTAIIQAEINKQTGIMEADFKEQGEKINMVLTTLKDNFQNVQTHFDKLNTKLDTLALSIEKTATYSNYKINQARIKEVRQKYVQFVSTPNVMTLNELHDTCKTNDPHLALDWIQREVVYDQVGLQLISTILQDVEYDRNKLRQWAKVIMQDAMEAMYLREVCVGVWHGKNSANATVAAATFNMMQTMVSIMKPDNATKILMEAANSLPRYNESELYYSLCNSRKTSSNLFSDIVKTLDTVEQDLLKNFGKVLEQDLKKVFDDYSYMKPEVGEIYLKPMYDEAVKRINNKYYWTKCWVGLSKSLPTIRSGDRTHFAQAGANGMFLSALCVEPDATYPALEKMAWPQMGQFWDSNGFQPGRPYQNLPKPDVFDGAFSNQDNLVMVTVPNTADFLVNAQDPFAAIREMGGTFCQQDGKVLPYSQCSPTQGTFAAYFASKTIPNTMACKETHDVLAQKNIQRSNQCSLEAFRYVVKSFVWTHALKTFAMIKTLTNESDDAKYSAVSDTLYDSLSNQFGDFHWEVYFVVGDSIDSCDVLETNCIMIPFSAASMTPPTVPTTPAPAPPAPPATQPPPPAGRKKRQAPAPPVTQAPPPVTQPPPPVWQIPNSKVIAIWSPKCDMTPHVDKAKGAIDSMLKYSEHLYGATVIRQAMNLTEDLRSAMLSFMIDPPTYVKNENLTAIDNGFGKSISNINFFSNNVLTVLPKGSAFYSKSDSTSYKSSTQRITTKRSVISETLQQLSDHRVLVSYYANYDKTAPTVNGYCSL